MNENFENEALDMLNQKEKSSGLDFDKTEPVDLGKAESFKNQAPLNVPNDPIPMGMESPWKNIPVDNLSSQGFGYPEGMEIAIKAATVAEIRHFSTIDENDPISVDDKINYIIEKCSMIRYSGGILSYMDLYQEDRFYIFMAIRDFTFIKGENKILIPTENKCDKDECPIPSQVELKSNLLSSYRLDEKIKKYYDHDSGCFILTPKNGEEPIQLFIPTIGIVAKIKKLLREKSRAGKKYDESFAAFSPYVIPNWRDLSESLYDEYERISKGWTYTQFNIVDSITKEITFATRNEINLNCQRCGAEVAAPIRFRGGLRSLYIISDIFGELL
jgi:hypothetical protein